MCQNRLSLSTLSAAMVFTCFLFLSGVLSPLLLSSCASGENPAPRSSIAAATPGSPSSFQPDPIAAAGFKKIPPAADRKQVQSAETTPIRSIARPSAKGNEDSAKPIAPIGASETAIKPIAPLAPPPTPKQESLNLPVESPQLGREQATLVLAQVEANELPAPSPSAQPAPTPEPGVGPPPAAAAITPVAAETALKGQMSISFGTRENTGEDGKPNPGAEDRYTFNFRVKDFLECRGNIVRRPRLLSSVLGRETQAGELRYEVEFSALGAAEKVKLGKIRGGVAVDAEGRYQLGKKSLFLDSIAVGAVPASSNIFGGFIQGKKAEQRGLLSAKLHEYTRVIRGKKLGVTSNNIDPLEFSNLSLAAGPVPAYPQTKVSGNLDYDYDTGNWYTNGIRFTYSELGTEKEDTITGSIKWVEDPLRDSNGKGQYEFNLRFNEAKLRKSEDEATFFESGGKDEELFFAVDEELPALIGSIRYQDSFAPSKSGDNPIVVKSVVTYALQSRQLTKTQLVNFVKLWLLIVGPVNDE